MNEIDAIRSDFTDKRPQTWQNLPDLDLYMDQVIAFLGRTQLAPEDSQKLTAAMVNNYVKEGLLPRAKGKRYERDHVALLQIFVALKEVVTVKEAGTLLNSYIADAAVEDRYDQVLAELGGILDETVSRLPEDDSKEALVEAALTFALDSYANKMACQRLIEILNRQMAEEAELEKAKQDKKNEKRDKK